MLLVPTASFLWHKKNWPLILPSREKKIVAEEVGEENSLTMKIKIVAFFGLSICQDVEIALTRVSRTAPQSVFIMSEPKWRVTELDTDFKQLRPLCTKYSREEQMLYASFSSFHWKKDLFTFRNGKEGGAGKQQQHPTVTLHNIRQEEWQETIFSTKAEEEYGHKKLNILWASMSILRPAALAAAKLLLKKIPFLPCLDNSNLL